jgi:hypothetical protein
VYLPSTDVESHLVQNVTLHEPPVIQPVAQLNVTDNLARSFHSEKAVKSSHFVGTLICISVGQAGTENTGSGPPAH